jgi:hypothetical protein
MDNIRIEKCGRIQNQAKATNDGDPLHHPTCRDYLPPAQQADWEHQYEGY